MAFEDTDLSGLGREARARIVAGDKAKSRSEDMYKSAGLYLIEAKKRVSKTKGLTWSKWLSENCPIGVRRSYDLISLADGTVTLEQMRENKAASVAEVRKRQKSTKSVESALRSAQSSQIREQYQQKEVQEAVAISQDEYVNTLREVNALVSSLTLVQLKHVKGLIEDVKGR
jgi:hypothetical protein